VAVRWIPAPSSKPKRLLIVLPHRRLPFNFSGGTSTTAASAGSQQCGSSTLPLLTSGDTSSTDISSGGSNSILAFLDTSLLVRNHLNNELRFLIDALLYIVNKNAQNIIWDFTNSIHAGFILV